MLLNVPDTQIVPAWYSNLSRTLLVWLWRFCRKTQLGNSGNHLDILQALHLQFYCCYHTHMACMCQWGIRMVAPFLSHKNVPQCTLSTLLVISYCSLGCKYHLGMGILRQISCYLDNNIQVDKHPWGQPLLLNNTPFPHNRYTDPLDKAMSCLCTCQGDKGISLG